MLKNQAGITLVALVVTIIVLIILATISITVAINGQIIARAQAASEWQANAEAEFNELDSRTANYIDQYIVNAGLTPPVVSGTNP